MLYIILDKMCELAIFITQNNFLVSEIWKYFKNFGIKHNQVESLLSRTALLFIYLRLVLKMGYHYYFFNNINLSNV